MRNNNSIKKNNTPTRSNYSYRVNKKNMNKDSILPIIFGVILGAMIMMFWQFNARLNNVGAALTQLDSVVSQNNAAVNEIVNFINQQTGATNQGGAAE